MAKRVLASTVSVMLLLTAITSGEHHMKWKVEKRQGGSTSVPLLITNNCAETIYPGILTQGGTGPADSGFKLSPGANHSLMVSTDWQGRVWGRTNCSFDDSGHFSGSGRACTTGDCGPVVACTGTGELPATLAEFTLSGANGQSYYDLSMVDGYNLPMAIELIAHSMSNVDDIPPNQSNPSCVASVGNYAGPSFNPYTSGSKTFLGTNASFQLPFLSASSDKISNWCPWDLQVSPPTSPGDGVYPYPDGNVQRLAFDPCFSACAKYNEPAYCCTGKYGPSKCQANYFSKAAKAVCPDAYSFAYDDADSTFAVPKGAGFNVVLCPGGASTTILATARNSSQVQHSGTNAMVASYNAFAKGLALTDGMAMKAVLAVTLLVVLVI
ncbi:hypothetical protein LTR95_005254 [Oleoguttula sp. CCFEE 5521]